jgi:hypothetical protein
VNDGLFNRPTFPAIFIQKTRHFHSKTPPFSPAILFFNFPRQNYIGLIQKHKE